MNHDSIINESLWKDEKNMEGDRDRKVRHERDFPDQTLKEEEGQYLEHDHPDDPADIYFKEMARKAPLTREEEIQIAMRIESGQRIVTEVMVHYPVLIKKVNSFDKIKA